MRLSLRSSSTELDVTVSAAAEPVTIGDVFRAAGLPCDPGSAVDADGYRCDPDTRLRDLDLSDGAVIVCPHQPTPSRVEAALADHGHLTGSDGRDVIDPDRPVVELVTVAGPGAGRRRDLAPGVYDLCVIPRTRSASSGVGTGVGVARLAVGADGGIRVAALGGAGVAVDGRPIGEEPVAGRWIEADGAVFRVAPLGRHRPRPALVSGGRTSFVRPPRLHDAFEPDPVLAPPPPPPPREPEPLSMLLLLLPIPAGIVMAYFFSPLFLMFTLLSPIMAVGRWVDGKRRMKKGTIERARIMGEQATQFADELDDQRHRKADWVRASRPDLAGLGVLADRGDPDLWRSRTTHDDFFRPVVGVGVTRWQPAIQGDPATPELQAVAAEAARLPMTPVTADLREGLAIGIVGPLDDRRRLAAAIVAQLAVEHGPADLTLAVLLTEQSARIWDHLKWLPHLAEPTGGLRVSTSVDGADRLAARLLPEVDRSRYRPGQDELVPPVPLFLVDSGDLVAGGVRPLAARLPRSVGRAIVLASTVEELPAFCTSYLRLVVAADGRPLGELVEVGTGLAWAPIVPVLADGVVAPMARSLARFTDPEAAGAGVSLPDQALLRDLLGIAPEAGAVGRAWADPPDGCQALLGAGEQGALGFELLRDGPHALVAGTTGAGKSELLRSLVVSLAARYGPDQVTFVLVDFKGGGAFDVFAELPHNVGVVTDLDEHLAGRALRCLQAELKHRELRLRDAGVSDLVDLPPGGDPLPRLLIIVDEFATLAAELPDFLDALVDVAQRGRSLGIHMILATQRPTGVVDAKIRANTNLRIALRVQDDRDSIDVIGSGDAADIDRRHPGRAFARFGAAELVGFQSALVSVETRATDGPALRLDTFELLDRSPGHDEVGEEAAPVTTAAGAEDEHRGAEPDVAGVDGAESGATAEAESAATAGATDVGGGLDDLARYVIAARQAAADLGLPPPRVPWPDPLPPTVDAERLMADTPSPDGSGAGSTWRTPLGVVDLPDLQRQDVFWWGADDGNLIVYGIEPGAATSGVATAVLGLARTHPADALHVYVIDFAGSLAALRRLPHTGGYVAPDDDERLLRTLGVLEGELDRRRRLVEAAQVDRITPTTRLHEPTPLVTLVVANYAAVLEAFEELGELGAAGRLAQIVRDGPALGVVTLVAAQSERDVPNRVAQGVEAKLIQRLADPNAYMMFGLRPKEVPELVPGRAIDVRTGDEVQLANFAGGDLRAAVDEPAWTGAGAAACAPGSGGPVEVRVLGDDVDLADLTTASTAEASCWRLAIGLAHHDLQPVALELRRGTHAMVGGSAGSGKTSTLIALAAAARRSDPGARIAVASARPEEWEEAIAALGLLDLDTITAILADGEGDAVQAGDGGGDPRALVLLDGIEGARVPTDVLDGLATRPEQDVHLIVSGRYESLRGLDRWLKAVAGHRTGIALRPSMEHGDLFRCRFPTPKGVAPPGRGYVVNEGLPVLAQVARRRQPTAEVP
ncbi:MAG: FtsK/SpoIIIE domain-containing protein, partial [Actinomycetota bacterium]